MFAIKRGVFEVGADYCRLVLLIFTIQMLDNRDGMCMVCGVVS